MHQSEQKEQRSFTRAAIICFACVILCLVFDIQKFYKAGHIIFDLEFFLSILLYALLIFLGIRSFRKAKAGAKERKKTDQTARPRQRDAST